MDKRYCELYRFDRGYYKEGSPVIILACALLEDSLQNRVLAQIKFKNISPKPIKTLTVQVASFDSAERKIDSTENTYLDLDAACDKVFGSKVPVYLPEKQTRYFYPIVKEVVFADRTIWTCPDEEQWEILPAVQTLDTYFKSGDLADQFRINTESSGNETIYEQNGIWHCSCGSYNYSEEPACHGCGAKKAALFSMFNIDALIEDCNARLMEEERQKELAKQERQAKMERAKQQFRKKIPFGIIAILLVIAAILIIPPLRFRASIQHYDSLEEAFSAIEGIWVYEEVEDGESVYKCYEITDMGIACATHSWIETDFTDRDILDWRGAWDESSYNSTSGILTIYAPFAVGDDSVYKPIENVVIRKKLNGNLILSQVDVDGKSSHVNYVLYNYK